jgi:hypothetical protein
MDKFTIIQDTREQKGWGFEIYPQCVGIVRQKLDEGDYSLQELVDLEKRTGRKILRIERKKSTGELAGNLGYKWWVFCNELKLLQECEHKAIILEFDAATLLEFPEGSGIPRSRWFRKNKDGKLIKNIRINGNFMMARIEKIRNDFGIPVIFAGSPSLAQAEAMEIFKKVYNANKAEIQKQS